MAGRSLEAVDLRWRYSRWRRAVSSFVGYAAAASVVFVWFAGASPAEVRQAPNSRVALDLPGLFVPSSRFSGFEHAASGTSIVIAELPEEAFPALETGFSAERLAERGMRLLEKRTTQRSEPHIFAHARQKAAGIEFEKLFLIFKGGGRTVLLSANIPLPAVTRGDISLGAIERALASATVREQATEAPLFEIVRPGRLRPADALVGTTQSYTLSGRLVPGADGTREDLVLIVAPSLDKRVISDVKAFAMKAIADLTRAGRVTYGKVGPVSIDGMDGYEIHATVEPGAEPGYERYHQIVLVARGGGYFRLISMSKGPDAEKLLGEAIDAATSFRLKR